MKKQKTFLERLQEYVDQGCEIKVRWEGGNDSGSLYATIDGHDLDWKDEFGEQLINEVEDALDYGSWAGDYFADGEVFYNPETGCLEGEGKETVSDSTCIELSGRDRLPIRIPKALNFDRIEIDSEGNFADDFHVTVKFLIAHGPIFREHLELETAIETNLFDSIVYNLENQKEDIGWVYNEWSWRREQFEEDGDDLVVYIDCVDYQINVTTHNSYQIKINGTED